MRFRRPVLAMFAASFLWGGLLLAQPHHHDDHPGPPGPPPGRPLPPPPPGPPGRPLPPVVAPPAAAPPAYRYDRAEYLRRMEAERRAEEARHLEEHRRADEAYHRHDYDYARWRDLEARERAARLADADRRALEEMRAARARRYAAWAAEERAREASYEARRLEARRLAWARYQHHYHEPLWRAEIERDAQIMASLQRARAVAVAEGRSDMVARCDRLIALERARHYNWMQANS